MSDFTRRRAFITLLGGAVAAWPLAARAQPSAMPVVGFLGTASAGPFAHLVASLRRGLQETGFVCMIRLPGPASLVGPAGN
jgi:putative ABC transport system substrate-binding protein